MSWLLVEIHVPDGEAERMARALGPEGVGHIALNGLLVGEQRLDNAPATVLIGDAVVSIHIREVIE